MEVEVVQAACEETVAFFQGQLAAGEGAQPVIHLLVGGTAWKQPSINLINCFQNPFFTRQVHLPLPPVVPERLPGQGWLSRRHAGHCDRPSGRDGCRGQ